MNTQLLKSTLYHLKSQRILSTINILGTTLAIFLIMIVVMLQQVKTAPFPPESNRDRFLHYNFVSISLGDNKYANAMCSPKLIKELIDPLETPETYTFYIFGTEKAVASVLGNKSTSVSIKGTDHRFWNVFDFDFITGKPFTAGDFDTKNPVAVINHTIAKKLFDSADNAIGKEFWINGNPYKVTGVVNDVTRLANTAYAEIWTVINVPDSNGWDGGYCGDCSATILAKSKNDIPAIWDEVQKLTTQVNKRLEAENYYIENRERPYTQKIYALNSLPNESPDYASHKKKSLLVYLILLIVPAINLLSMTHSRLQQRTAEIAVRRAFGSKKTSIIVQILTENLILTLIAGIIGLLLSIGFAWCYDSYLFMQRNMSLSDVSLNVSASLPSLLQLSTFGWALLSCFILNLLSGIIPAWRASRTSLSRALSGHVN
ncbi:ABC transporter permease [uncultured Muribaculum sp.]|uniref:ABC transporter permease n=2 Tax=uncultured Muribaculum sp. TaxID=1918613 RepID=UPI00272D83A0|nr:ABC transporter permease [uncultured Muribaculum sp.]